MDCVNVFPGETDTIAMLEYHLAKPQQILILQVAMGVEIGIQGTKTGKPVPLCRRSLPDLSSILHLRLDEP